MTGAWLTRLARRILHAETFELVVSPAIADLQFETPAAALAGRVRDYAAVWRALAGGVCLDLSRRSQGLRNDAPLLVGLACLQACYYGCMLTLAMQHLSTQHTVALIAVIVFVSVAFTVLDFWPGATERLPLPGDDL